MIKNVYHWKGGRSEGRIILGNRDSKRLYRAFLRQSTSSNKDGAVQKKEGVITNVALTFGTVFSEWFESNSARTKEPIQANYLLKAEYILPVYASADITDIALKSIVSSGMQNISLSRCALN